MVLIYVTKTDFYISCMVKTLIAHFQVYAIRRSHCHSDQVWQLQSFRLRQRNLPRKVCCTLRVFVLLIKPVAFYFLASIVLSFPPASKWLSRREKNERKKRDLCRPPTAVSYHACAGVSLATGDAVDRGAGVLWKILRDKEMPRTPFVIV